MCCGSSWSRAPRAARSSSAASCARSVPKAMKFKDGYMIASGQPVNDFIDSAVRHVLLRQGVLGIKVMSP